MSSHLFESGPEYDTVSTTTSTSPTALSSIRRATIFKAAKKIEKTTLEQIFSLRCKTITTLFLLFSIVIIVFCAVLFGIFPKRLVDLETDRVYKGYERVSSYSSDLLQFLYIVADGTGYSEDYGDTFDFPMYLPVTEGRETISPRAMHELGLQWISFYYPNGSLYYQVGYNSNTTDSVFKLSNMNQLDVSILKANFSDLNWAYPALVSSNRIPMMTVTKLLYNANNAIGGFITVGRFLQGNELQIMADATQLCVSILLWDDERVKNEYYRLADKAVTPSFKQNWHADTSISPRIVPLKSEFTGLCPQADTEAPYTDVREGSFLVNDISGSPRFVFQVRIHTKNMYIGLVSMFTAFAVLVAGILVVAFVLVILVDVVVLNRISKINSQLEKITIDRNVKARLARSKSGDEVAILIKCVNKMLTSLDKASTKIHDVLTRTLHLEERSRNMIKAMHDYVICVLSKDGSIQESNPQFQESFTNLKNKSIEAYTDLSLKDLIEMSTTQEQRESFFVTRFRQRIPVKIRVSPCTIFIDEQPYDALVIVGQNKSEQEDMMHKLKFIKDDLDFMRVWEDPIRREDFWQYCIKERSKENVMFLQQVELYKLTKAAKDRVKLQNQIYQRFLLPTSEDLLNLSGKILDKELPLIKEGYAQRDLFDSLERFVRNMVVSDTFRRYNEQTRGNGRYSIRQ
ncbi:RGS9 [Acrasis kona]|uniref:RGS9 n=1 Tax=Acrasis kona TaxID=1008807 RepID=A0AAW2ZNG2_9EUKA